LSVGYVDTSCLVAIAFRESGATAAAKRLNDFDELVSSNLLESELRSTFARQGVPFEPSIIAGIRWILPSRPLGAEMQRALANGYLRGADLWHIACALSVVMTPSDMTFLTLDERQRALASAMGFVT
jgi:predicted nucleic acid-binding protein